MDTIPFEARRFRSTAAYYARYRVPYPPALLAGISARVGLKPGDRVLDLGCGPAMLGLGFARLGMKVTGVDPEPEMLEAAAAAAADANLPITLVQGSSYDLGPQLGRLKLVVMGRSFHWMDRLPTLAALDKLVEPGGAVALFYDRKIETEPNWRSVVENLSVKYVPDRERRHSRDRMRHEPLLLQSAFSAVEERGLVFAQQLGIDDIVGRAFSMSVTSPESLGTDADAFEAELREKLAPLADDGRFSEVVAAETLIGFRPGEVPVNAA
jgi:SAM-dependent methyltransferase